MFLRWSGPGALLVAILALVVALGGVSNGAPPPGDAKAVASAQRAKRTSMRNFNRALKVVDNGTASIQLANVRGLGRIRGTCQDGNPAPGVEDPDMVITVLAGRQGINFARHSALTVVGRALRAAVGYLPPRTPHDMPLPDSTTFDVRLEAAGHAEQMLGFAREDAQETPDGGCLFYGIVITVDD